MDWELLLKLVPFELWNTIYMVFVSAFFACLIGFPLGVALVVTDKGGFNENLAFYRTLGWIVNIGRSIPFAILMIALIPLTRAIVGTSLGTTASIVPLTIATAPFVARLVEGALKGVERGVIEAAIVMGAGEGEIIRKVLFPEALPSLLNAITLTLVNLVGYSAMAGLVGGGGLGKLAIQYGYQRFNGFLMVITLIILLLFVESVQWIGNTVVKKLERRRGKR